MVGIMLAAGSSSHHRTVEAKHHRGASPVHFSGSREPQQWPAGEVYRDTRSIDGGFTNGGMDENLSITDLTDETGTGALSPGSSECILWCSVALGGLVRGCPVAHVRNQLSNLASVLSEAPCRRRRPWNKYMS